MDFKTKAKEVMHCLRKVVTETVEIHVVHGTLKTICQNCYVFLLSADLLSCVVQGWYVCKLGETMTNLFFILSCKMHLCALNIRFKEFLRKIIYSVQH